MNLQTLCRTLLHKTRTQAVLITNLTNIHYLTGLKVSAGVLLIQKSSITLFLDSRYTEVAESSLPRTIKLSPPANIPAAIRPLRSAAFEGDDLTVLRLARWKKQWGKKRFVPTSGLIEAYRAVKTSHELTSLRKACRVAKKLLRSVPRFLATGITERELSYALERLAIEYGAEAMSFETIVAFGENSSRPHHHPTDRKLQQNDVVQIDLGVVVNGYCSDYSRVFVYGTKTVRHRLVERALREAKQAAEKLVRPGVDVRTLDRAARAVLQRYDLEKYFTHSLGHGLGLEIHEAPLLSQKSKPYKLRKNEVITIEPGVYFSGEWGMRIEDTIIVS